MDTQHIYALWTLSHIWGAEGIELFHASISLGAFLSWMSARNCIPCKACIFLLLLAILNAGSLLYFACRMIKPAQNAASTFSKAFILRVPITSVISHNNNTSSPGAFHG